MKSHTTTFLDLLKPDIKGECLGDGFRLAVRTIIELTLLSRETGATTSSLAMNFGVSIDTMNLILYKLHEAEIIHRDIEVPSSWTCMKRLENITFAQIFQCLSFEKSLSSASSVTNHFSNEDRKTKSERTQNGAEVMLAQANLQIYQTVMKQLEKFNMGSLGTSRERTGELPFVYLTEFV